MKLFFISLIALVVALAAFFAYKQKAGLSVPSPSPSSLASSPEVKEASEGKIEGSLSYPSEVIPENMVVCAQNIVSNETACTKDKVQDDKFTYGLGYSLSVKEGKYQVYAYLDDNPTHRAYYNEFVTCGMSIDCTSHKAIEIAVGDNQTVTGVDPQDWYQTPQINPNPESFPEGNI